MNGGLKTTQHGVGSEDTAVKLLLRMLFNKYIFLSQQFYGIAKIR